MEFVEWMWYWNVFVVMYEDEVLWVCWLEIVYFVEWLGSGFLFILLNLNDWMMMVGFISEMFEFYGFVWNGCLLFMFIIYSVMGDVVFELFIF